MDGFFQIDINERIEKDLDYIENDIIAKQFKEDKNANKDEREKFIKFCKPLNAIGIIDMTKKQYKKYWNTQYLNHPKQKQIIFEAIEEKFKNGLTTKDEMINIIKNSKDSESEKVKAIKLLEGEK